MKNVFLLVRGRGSDMNVDLTSTGLLAHHAIQRHYQTAALPISETATSGHVYKL